MATLNNTNIFNTFKQLLQIGSGNVGLTASIQYVQDGNGNSTLLGLSNTVVSINSTTITINGSTLGLTGNSSLNGTFVGSVNGTFTGTSSGTNTGDVALSINVQRFTSSGAFTYTPTVGTKVVKVTLVGGGGGSGGISIAGAYGTSGGGAGGAAAIFYLTIAQVGSSLTGSVGAGGTAATAGNNSGGNGGDTTLATTSAWTAHGGHGGSGMVGTTSPAIGPGSSSSPATVVTGTGLLVASAVGQQPSFNGVASSGAGFNIAIAGGNSGLAFGQVVAPIISSVASPLGGGVVVSQGPGAGASGAVVSGSAANTAGFAGNAGIAIFEEYILA